MQTQSNTNREETEQERYRNCTEWKEKWNGNGLEINDISIKRKKSGNGTEKQGKGKEIEKKRTGNCTERKRIVKGKGMAWISNGKSMKMGRKN